MGCGAVDRDGTCVVDIDVAGSTGAMGEVGAGPECTTDVIDTVSDSLLDANLALLAFSLVELTTDELPMPESSDDTDEDDEKLRKWEVE